MSIARKLRRIAERKRARAESLLWTDEDKMAYLTEKHRLLNKHIDPATGKHTGKMIGNEAASRRAYRTIRKQQLEQLRAIERGPDD